MAANPLSWLMGFFSLDIGIDLGTANTLVNVRGKGIVINEPSWVVINKKTHETIAVGASAKEMVGRTPQNFSAIRPLRDGVISEFEITKSMLEYFIGKVHQQTHRADASTAGLHRHSFWSNPGRETCCIRCSHGSRRA